MVKRCFTILIVFFFCTTLSACAQVQTVTSSSVEQISSTTPAATEELATAIQTATNTSQNSITEAITAEPDSSTVAYRINGYTNVTYPDNSEVMPGTTFVKTWRLTNAGSATWTPDFKLIFVGGNAMGAKGYILLGKKVAPGDSIEVSLTLTAPSTPDTYVGKWMLQTTDGQNFGLGENGDVAIWAKIVVEKIFTITSAIPVFSTDSYTGACPMTLAVKAQLTANRSGTATYSFVTSLGNSDSYEMSFTDAGTHTSTEYDLIVNTTSDVSVSIYNDEPNHQQFDPVTFSVTCVP
jgi:hypothetical protein